MGVSEKAVLSCTAYPPARVSRRGGIEVLDAGAFMGNHCEFFLEKRRITRIPPRFEYQWRTHASGAVYCFETSWEKEPSAGELRFLRNGAQLSTGLSRRIVNVVGRVPAGGEVEPRRIP
jgi:hypothetical protein